MFLFPSLIFLRSQNQTQIILTQISRLQSPAHCRGLFTLLFFQHCIHQLALVLINSCTEINLEKSRVDSFRVYMIRTSLKDQRLFLSSSTDANSSPSPPPSQMYPSSSQSSAALLRFYLIIRPPRPFHAGCRMEMRPIHFFRDGLVDVWVEGDRDPRVEAPSPGLH